MDRHVTQCVPRIRDIPFALWLKALRYLRRSTSTKFGSHVVLVYSLDGEALSTWVGECVQRRDEALLHQ